MKYVHLYGWAVIALTVHAGASSADDLHTQVSDRHAVAVEAASGMVVTAHTLASDAGVAILRKGGNAVDAAITVGFVLAVVYPFAGNVGGGGFMLIHRSSGGDSVIDYRETAPAAASRDMFTDGRGAVVAGDRSSVSGWRASGVPGTVAGFALAYERYGSHRLSWSELIEPARRLAAEGHIVSAGTVARLKAWERIVERDEVSRRIYLNNGRLWMAGQRWRQPELAATLRRLQRDGPREFYEGETARRLAAAMAAHGGTITLADLKAYRPVERAPLRGQYRGRDIVTVPPPSSGGVTLLQMLGMLEPFDVATLKHNSAPHIHLLAEVMRRAFHDRALYLGDPDFIHVPMNWLLNQNRLSTFKKSFRADRASRSLSLLPESLRNDAVQPTTTESSETTHYSIADAAGNAVANTYTLNYSSGVTIAGTGILMNNEMDDFTAKPGAPNMFGLIHGEGNSIAPGKRPLSSMTPTMMLSNGRLVLVTGSPGGPTIINTVLQIISNVVDYRWDVEHAVEAGRMHHQWLPDELVFERGIFDNVTTDTLASMGYVLRERVGRDGEGIHQGDAETIAIDSYRGMRWGMADPRKPDSRAAGY